MGEPVADADWIGERRSFSGSRNTPSPTMNWTQWRSSAHHARNRSTTRGRGRGWGRKERKKKNEK